jgi:hypothetical protein
MTTTTKPFKVSKVGLQLPNVADAGATVLDWYEEGVVTTGLTLTALTTQPTSITYATRSMKWTRTGNVVHFSLGMTGTMTGGVGYLMVNGFPFAASVSAVGNEGRVTGQLSPCDSGGLDVFGPIPTMIRFIDGVSYGRPMHNDGISLSCASVSAYGGAWSMAFTGHYFTA